MSLPAAEVALLERTRSAVGNALVGAGLAIAASGVVLRGRERGATLWPPDQVRRGALATLLAHVVASYATRRILASRPALRDPTTRAARFFRAHVVAAALGALAVPLGFSYAFAALPTLEAVGPFWVAGLALGVLALPRARDLEAFADPLPAIAATEASAQAGEARP